eukprot:TRINITY_DN1389_c0_g1_i1.p1 TRINITY_DN1389_c0_g1~~TRINITY_DN1389_c0_g1_i1.p1  ORF type:complete len:613 (+),score=202.66 TRINITY_DN1389_c0_g1_i1:221-2059(+)
MGAYLTKPSREKTSEDSENYRFSVGASSMQGWRLSQEDAHNAILSYDSGCCYFGVYDGHGGHEVAAYTALHLPKFIKDSKEFAKGNIQKALEECFVRFDETLTRPEVISALRKIMNKGEDEADADEVNNLYQEATMPIEDLIAKLKENGGSAGEEETDENDEEEEEGEEGSTLLKNKDVEKLAESSSSSSSRQPKSPFLLAKRTASNRHTRFDENGQETEANNTNGKTENGVSKEEEAKEEVHSNGRSASKVLPKGKGKGKGKGKSNNNNNHQQETPAPAVPEEEEVAVPKEEKKPKKSAQDLYLDMMKNDQEDDSSDDEDSSDDAFGNSRDSSDDDEDDDDDDVEGDSEPDTEDDEDEEAGMMGPSNSTEEPGNDSGCTAVVGLIVKDELFVANAGDSRCVVCRNGEAIEMSLDHKPEDEPEKTRIEKAGGNVTADGRVDGGLNLSRALGDHAYKLNASLPLIEQMISPQPDIKTLKLDPKTDSFIILACDGIWNSMSSQEVVDFVKPRIEKSPDKMSSICEELFDACLAPDTSGDGTGCDNMTAVLIKITDFYNPQNEASSCKRPPPEDEDAASSSSCSKKLKTGKPSKADQDDIKDANDNSAPGTSSSS